MICVDAELKGLAREMHNMFWVGVYSYGGMLFGCFYPKCTNCMDCDQAAP